MQGSTVENEKQKKQLDLFSLFLVVVVIASVVLAVAVYRQAFSSGLSLEPNNWSAFGSYVGGVFGPLISFLTLLAILKTIKLQKELLDTQRTEFESMQVLQVRTLESQLAQIEKANEEQERRLVEEVRNNLLKILDNYSAGLQQECDVRRRGMNTLLQWAMEGKKINSEDIEKVQKKISQYEGQLAAFSLLYDALCFEDYGDVKSIKDYYKSEMNRICSDPLTSPGQDLSNDQAID